MKRWCRQNSHDLNTAYTCGRCQQALLQHRFMKMKRELITISTYLKSSEHRKHTNDSASDLNIQAMCFKFLNLNFFSVIENGRVILTDDRRRHVKLSKKENNKAFPTENAKNVEVLETVEGLKYWKE
ncbi:hypothetical protein T01_14939 [Trichinella spiralis]|uniref:Uncharacterized protein n=1 Tax=Trichinella spiralis TaxID=6334 RepID=A0A0V1BK61_TRISP|nr:hypothetical protein T01_14939 [Trichinella spiralis]